MTSNTVQAALEAIDGYLEKLMNDDIIELTFQDIYDNSCPNPTLNLTCGDLTIEGPGDLIINTDTNITQEVTITGGGPININVSGDVNIDGYNVTITSTNTSTINGENGIVLDGYGENVIPANSCTDSLGDATHGWTEIYLCDGSNNVIALGGAGDVNAPNSNSGATVVGTNSTNFDTFGPDMTDNTVQAALEAIDGYLKSLSLEGLDTTYVNTGWLDINGCVLNGVGKIHTSSGTPGLSFTNGGVSRASWSMPVPSDWDGISDIEVEVIWSPATSGSGDVAWRLEYKTLSLTELSSSAATNDDYTQAVGGTADAIQSTAANLTIPASSISLSDEIIVINIVRRGTSGSDTYNNSAYVHLVKFNYVAQNIV
jgi:hypothetical protein